MAIRVLVTGISGFIAKHVALDLLNAGYEVRGTVRDLKKSDQVRKTLTDAGANGGAVSFAAADLTSDDGWDEAAAGCDAVMHLASPFPMSQPRDRYALTPAARDGALRVLRASRKAERIVMTSSMAAVMYRAGRGAEETFSENDWTDVSWQKLSAYVISKTEAEKAAWETAAAEGYKHRLTTVNPGFVLGPTLDDYYGASVDTIRLFMTGAYPAVPKASFPMVDVRDVAALHRLAMETPNAGGRRLLAVSDTKSLKDIGDILREEFPDYAKKIPNRDLPDWLVRIVALFDRNLATVLPDLGCVPHVDNAYVTSLTGMKFRPGKEAIIEAARSLQRIKAV
jgi:nucleoside-diphosphate-sugar epimerase